MRPVVVPTTPPPVQLPGQSPSYDPAQFQESTLYTISESLPGSNKKLVLKKATVAEGTEELTTLLELWTGEGAPTEVVDGKTEMSFDSDDNKIWKYAYREGIANGSNFWGRARRQLIQAIGPYCSYCGLRLDSNLHIEHVVPKKYFANRAFLWSNFLLACPTCNSCKSDAPDLWDVYQQMKLKLDPSTQSTDYANAADWIRGTSAQGLHYLWADVDWASWMPPPPTPAPPAPPALPSAFPFYVALCSLEKAPRKAQLEFGTPLTPIDILFARQEYIKGTLAPEDGRWCLEQGKKRIYFGLKIGVRDGLPPNVSSAAAKLIEIANLNKIVPANARAQSVDRRVELRTRAWFEAKQAADDLNAAAAEGDATTGKILARHLTERIRATGSWLVWLSVLKAENVQGAADLVNGALAGTLPRDWTF